MKLIPALSQLHQLIDGLVRAGKNPRDYGIVVTPRQDNELFADKQFQSRLGQFPNEGTYSRPGHRDGVSMFMSTQVSDMAVIPLSHVNAFFDGLGDQ